MPEATAAEIVRRFLALAEQARVAELTSDVGHEGQDATGDPLMNLDAAIRSTMTTGNMDYNAALGKLAKEQPEIIKAAYGR